jgi:EpsG family
VNPFPEIFYAAAIFAAIAASLAVCVRSHARKDAAVFVLIAPLIVVYLLGMYRTDGVDFDAYEAYLNDRDLIPDIGYKVLMELAATLEMGLSEFFLIQGLFTVIAVYVLARKLKSDLVVTIALYVIHGAIVRDFSQSRTALALAIYFVALAQDRRLVYLILTAAAISVHLTLVPLVVAYHWIRMVLGFKRGQTFFIVVPALAVLLGMAVLLPMLSAMDPRIEIYLNWSEDLYGNPVDSYSTLLLFLPIAAVIFRAYQLTRDETTKVFLILILYAAVTFVAFRHLAIFAFRLSNVVAALYPFAIGRAIFLLKNRDQRLVDVAIPLALVGALLFAVLLRPGSFDVLKDTQPALLSYGR